jgi:pyruvate dehydrogenase E2 component (dihydrolipoamide acetyltransferase)
MSAGGPKGQTTIVEPTAPERAIVRRVAESRATVPDLELSVGLRHPPVRDTAPLLRSCARALAEHPRANAAYRDGHFELYSRVNVGLVLALDDAYLIPTVFDADRKTVDELADEIEHLGTQATAGQLAAPDFSGATFTLWNAAALGLGQASIPVVPPQAAALAAGTTTLTLTCDHRILYGARAARFLTAVRQQLELVVGGPSPRPDGPG